MASPNIPPNLDRAEGTTVDGAGIGSASSPREWALLVDVFRRTLPADLRRARTARRIIRKGR